MDPTLDYGYIALPRESHDVSARWFTAASLALAAGVTALSLLALTGWWPHDAALKNLPSSPIVMNPLTAAALLLCAASLWLCNWPASPADAGAVQFLCRTCAVFVLLLGLSRLAPHGGWDLGLQRWLLKILPHRRLPDRMAPNEALHFILCGIALLLVPGRGGRAPIVASQLLADAVLLFSVFALTGSFYKARFAGDVGSFVAMTPPIAAGLLLVAAGILISWGTWGWVGWIAGSSMPGARMTRRMLLGAALFAGALMWSWTRGTQAALSDPTTGAVLIAVTSGALLIALFLYAAWELDRLDEKRRWVQEERDRFLNLCPELISIANFDGYYRMLNPAWETALGRSIEDIRSKPYLELIHPDDRAKTSLEIDRNVHGMKSVNFENRYQRKDGSYRWLLWTATPLVDQGLIYAAARDITDRKNVEALREEVSHHVNHELRGPMSAQLMSLQMIQADHGSSFSATAKRYLGFAVDAAEHLNRMISDLLDVTRSETGKLAVKIGPVDAAALAEKVVGAFEGSARNKGLTMAFEAEPGLPPASGDPVRVRQVISNLVDNAFKFTPEGGRITVRVGRYPQSPDCVQFCVQDTGQGMKPEDLKRIFDRLYQTTNVAREGTKGLGLGLYICKQLVEAQGGRIWVESEQGKGSAFFFILKNFKDSPAADRPA